MSVNIQLSSGERLEFGHGPLVIGRDPRCQICIDDKRGIHRQHARLREVDGRWLVETAGEWAIQVGQNRPTRSEWLNPGDVIKLSKNGHWLIFQPDAETAPHTSSYSPTVESIAVDTIAPPLVHRTPPVPLLVAPLPATPIPLVSTVPLWKKLVYWLAGAGTCLVVAALALIFWPAADGSPSPLGRLLPLVTPKEMQGLWEVSPLLEPPVDAQAGTKMLPLQPEILEKGPLGLGPSGLGGPLPEQAKLVAGKVAPWRSLSGHGLPVTGVAFAMKDSQVVSVGYDRSVRPWDLERATELRRRYGHTAAVTALAVSPDGLWATTGDLDGNLYRWNLDTPEEHELGVAAGPLIQLSIAPDGHRLLASTPNGIQLWDVKPAKMVGLVGQHRGFCGALFHGPDELFTFCEDNAFRRFELSHQKLTGRLTHAQTVCSMALSPDGRWLATGDSQGKIHLWDTQPTGAHHELTGHSSAVHHLVFSSSGKQILSGGEDGTVRVWDAAKRTESQQFQQPSVVRCVAFSVDSQMVATGGDDGDIRIWKLTETVAPAKSPEKTPPNTNTPPKTTPTPKPPAPPPPKIPPKKTTTKPPAKVPPKTTSPTTKTPAKSATKTPTKPSAPAKTKQK